LVDRFATLDYSPLYGEFLLQRSWFIGVWTRPNLPWRDERHVIDMCRHLSWKAVQSSWKCLDSI
jgi:hypothetical protein